MRKLASRLYSIWGIILFMVMFALLLPFFLLSIHVPGMQGLGPRLNRLWAWMFFLCMGMPVRLEFRGKRPSKKGKYIFLANHFSFLDIPSMGLIPYNFTFVGKSELGKVPLFGYMYRKLHITVDRSNWRDRYETLNRSVEALRAGKNLVIFPEGGIYTDNPPDMVRFKDGAFRAAIEEQIDLVPVTIPFNWIILPDDGLFLLRWGTQKIVIHEAISTAGKGVDDIPALKDQVFDVINEELKLQCHARG